VAAVKPGNAGSGQDWTTEPLRRHTGPTGAVEWIGRTSTYFWFGPGSGLWLSAGEDRSQCTRIEHPAADGTYDTRAQELRAIDAFRAAARNEPGRRSR
jgi:hypothetical protein